MWICILLIVAAAFLLACRVSAGMCFGVKSRGEDEPKVPGGWQYEEKREDILALIEGAKKLPYEDVWIDSHDGLRLHAKYYETRPGAPCHLLFHGYRSSALLDFSGGLQDALRLGHNALLVDQRGHAKSQGRYLSFGIKESRDCLGWIDYINRRCGEDRPVILQGLSMGAATVMMAMGLELPENVKGVVADCGYSSPERIIKNFMRMQHYPVRLLFPFVRLGGRIFAGFDVCSNSPEQALKKAKLPLLIIHGDADGLVPCSNSREIYDACASEDKTLIIVPNAGHGLSYLVDRERYLKAYTDFMDRIL